MLSDTTASALTSAELLHSESLMDADAPTPSAAGRGEHAAPALPRAASLAALGPMLARQLANSRRSGESLSLLWIETELLEAHASADERAVEAAMTAAAGQRLRQRVRGVDEVIQVGHNAFAVLLKGAAPADTAMVEQRLKHALGGAYSVTEQRVYVGVRMGVAHFPDCGRTGAELAEAAQRQVALHHGP
ncbi:diguanylate cyclase domain-containing protein [Roseateles sp. BYS87W]|uniref:Diguanylate cyclase domain-containing protein n=1 Tax=Pelomonas baiyunensis TaxID=3299026 RepID=A0ABW7GV39_9BURK